MAGEEPGIGGRCDARFAAVRDTFAANFADRDEAGAAACRNAYADPAGLSGMGVVNTAAWRAGVAFGYLTSQMGPRWQNSRNRALIDAVYGCV